MKSHITILFTLIIFNSSAQNAALDPNFGMGGYTITPNTLLINCFDFDTNGDIITTGFSKKTNGYYRLTLTKTNADGILDTSFGTNGIVTTAVEHSEEPLDIVVQPDGKIIVAGGANLGPTPTSPGVYIGFVVRYNNDGSLDTTFATNGIYREPMAKHFDSIILLSDSSIMLGGLTSTEGVLVKLQSNGLLNTTFGNNGILSLYSHNFQFISRNTILLSDGKLLCSGYDYSDINNLKTAYCKVDIQGNFDSSFGNNGKAIIDLYNTSPDVNEVIYTAKELPNGSIVFKGNIIDWFGMTYSTNFLIKINSNGILDTNFGTNGIALHTYPDSRLEVQPDGKIITGGTKEINTYNSGYSITRFDNNGILDTSFNNGNGFVDLDPTLDSDGLQYIKLQAADSLIIGGSSKLNSVSNFTLARILLDTPLSIQEPLEEFIKVYPNPFNDRLFVEDFEGIIESIKIYDNNGRIIKTLSKPNTMQEIDTAFTVGIYHIKITTKDGRTMNKKFIKK
jgi:uncharacterized delta-60 repeat protein